VNPDLQDGFGHYLHYDVRLREEARARGIRFTSLGNKKAAADLAPDFLVPTFSNNSWTAGRFRKPGVATAFARELKGALETGHASESDRRIYYLYLGSVRHAWAVLTLAAANPDALRSFHVNLFYGTDDFTSSGRLKDPVRHEYELVLGAVAAFGARLGVTVSVESQRLADWIRAATSYEVSVLPFFGVSRLSEEHAERVRARISRSPREGRVVYFPGNLHPAKGYDLFLDLVAKHRTSFVGGGVRFVMRNVLAGKEEGAIRRRLRRLRHSVEVIDGVLADDAYIELFVRADVIVLPYRRSAFAARTSAALADAMTLGIPVVAVRGTWLGDWVDALGCGATFEENSLPDFRDALRRVLDNHSQFVEGARCARLRWLAENTPGRLIDFLMDCGERCATRESDALDPGLAGLLEAAMNLEDGRTVLEADAGPRRAPYPRAPQWVRWLREQVGRSRG